MRALSPVFSARSLLLGACAGLALAACGEDLPPATDGGTRDASMPADGAIPADAPPPVDANFDGGTDAGPEPAPLFRNAVATADAELARDALRVLGSGAAGGSGSCSECHGITRQTIRYWRAMSDVAYAECFDDLEVPTQAAAEAVLDCLRGDDAVLPFDAAHAGVFASAARLEWIPFVFRRAVGDGWEAAYEDYVTRGGMPPEGETPLTQEEFDIVAEWFIRGVPMVDDVLPPDPAPTECTPGVSSDVAAHVAAMATTGWAARNAEDSILMHGCADAATAADCLSTDTLASTTTFGADWDVIAGSSARVLYTTPYRSSYWTRSSADGRFVGQGGGSPAGSTIIDLAADRRIGVSASYDPGFFPDNSGFMFLGGGGICEQSVLTTGTPTTITFSEPQCTSAAMVGLYEHVGASLAGGDYWAVHGQFVSDNGGHSRTYVDPSANFASDSRTRLTRLTNSGGGFVARETLGVATPYEGDAVLSPSSRLIVSRVAGAGGRQLGFVMRRIDATSVGGTWDIELPEVARYCSNGGKPAFSYDERWMVLHHYFGTSDQDALELGFTGAGDPGFASYASNGAANVFLVDLATGERTRITNMGPGQYALFPHFRSDGWIYFIVRSPSSGSEHVVASDAALVLASR